MQQKQKNNERRKMARDAVDGFVGWVDTVLALLGSMIGTNEPSISIDRHFVSVPKKPIQWSNIGV